MGVPIWTGPDHDREPPGLRHPLWPSLALADRAGPSGFDELVPLIFLFLRWEDFAREKLEEVRHAVERNLSLQDQTA